MSLHVARAVAIGKRGALRMAKSTDAPVIWWVRRDLRLADNDALRAAADSGRPVIPLYVLDPDRPRAPGAAGLWWLDKSLRALSEALAHAGSALVLRRGPTVETLRAVAAETGAERLHFGRLYEGEDRGLEPEAVQALGEAGVRAESFRGSLLTEPGEVKTGAGGAFQVYGPFWRALHARLREVTTAPAVRRLTPPPKPVRSEALESWGLHPRHPDWSTGFVGEPGEAGARRALDRFVHGALGRYRSERAQPVEAATARLSPHLHWGEVSSRQVWAAACAAGEAKGHEDEREKFLSELAWRDFSHTVLAAHPDLASRNYQARLEGLRWRRDPEGLHAWKRGRTGFPIVDAGMRELWRSGWMHNRARMITGAFLVKDLLIDWREGERWFWDTLVDADEANNGINWQWVAGTGPDAQPFFRVFNPLLQADRFDKGGGYVRQWCPELAKLPDKHIHAPWAASAEVLDRAGVVLGQTYPRPIVDHAQARDRALAAYKALQG
jgi:deoxyribodipyrimidine photo-lyase